MKARLTNRPIRTNAPRSNKERKLIEEFINDFLTPDAVMEMIEKEDNTPREVNLGPLTVTIRPLF